MYKYFLIIFLLIFTHICYCFEYNYKGERNPKTNLHRKIKYDQRSRKINGAQFTNHIIPNNAKLVDDNELFSQIDVAGFIQKPDYYQLETDFLTDDDLYDFRR